MANKKPVKFIKPNDDYQPSGDSAILSKNIEALDLSEYTLSKLKGAELVTIMDLCKCQMKHLYKIDGFGKKNVFEVLKKLQALGLDFKRVPKPEMVNKVENNVNIEVVAEQNDKVQKNFDKKQNNNNKFENKTQNKNNQAKNLNKKENVDLNKKQEKPKEQNVKENIDRQKTKSQKQEPKRLKVNSYDLDAFEEDSMTKTRNLKQERQQSIAKKISELPPIKNKDGLYKFYKHGKWGYKNEEGKIVIEPSFMEAFNFKEGLACVEIDEKCGFINTKGELVIPMIYDTACSFSEGLASVTKNEKCGYIDKEGNVVFDFIYEAATSFENDIALVKKDGKWGYMDRKTGEIRLR